MAMERDEAAEFSDILRRLQAQFGDVLGEDVIARELRTEVEALQDAPIRTFVPGLVQRRVSERLRHFA